MKGLKYIKDPILRIQLIHLLTIVLLLLNVVFFTENLIALFVQVVIIITILFRSLDDLHVKKTLDELKEQLYLDEEILNKSIIVSESDLEGKISYVNENFCRISGYSKEELLGKPHSIIKHPDTQKNTFKNLWQTIESGKTFHDILKNKKKNGEAYWVETFISPILKRSKLVGYRALRFDITEKMIADQYLTKELNKRDSLLQLQNTRFEFAINSSRDGFWDYNILEKKFYLSSGWKKRLGFNEDEEVSYLQYLSLIPDENRFEHHGAMMDVLEDRSENLEYVHFRISYPLVTKSGEKLFIEDVGDAFFDDEDELSRITGFHRDITEQKRQAKMIETQNRVAAMGEIMGNVAHQWRQPLAAMNNLLNNVEFDIELEDLKSIEVSRYLEVSSKLKSYTMYLSNTIDDFRKLTSDEKIKSKFVVLDLLYEAENMIQDAYQKENIDFAIVIEKDCNCELYGYRRELLQVVINILNNAKDVLVEMKVPDPKVWIDLQRDEKEISVLIHDNGGGIPDAFIDKIFDPYFTTKHESMGTGIGLFMSKKIIVEHFKGTIEVDNEKKGAVFTIVLPRDPYLL